METRVLAGFAVVLAALLILIGVLPKSTSAVPPPFEPAGVMCLETFESEPACDGLADPDAAADISLTFCVGWNEDCTTQDNPVTDAAVASTALVTPTDFSLPKGDTLPIGAIAGRIETEETLGLINNPCSNRIGAALTMMNASIDAGAPISPRPQGETDVMQPLALDANHNGIPDGADRYPSFLTQYFQGVQPRARLFGISHIQGSWITLNLVFFEPGATLNVGGTKITFNSALGYPALLTTQDPAAPDAVASITDLCAPFFIESITLGKTMDNPCSPTRVEGANCPTGQEGEPDVKERGYPLFPCDAGNAYDEDHDGKVNDGCPQANNVSESGAQCDNNTSDDGEDSTVNDGCPKFGDVGEGGRIPGACSGADEGGCTYRSNPGTSGSYSFTILAVSQRDADGDGIENSLDVCALQPNSGWNPREADPVNDPDNDGLPTECDPKPNEQGPGSPTGCKSGYTGADEDQDCFSNRADNCPLENQLERPAEAPDPSANKPLAVDSDGDGIGDACDPNKETINGENFSMCLKFPVNVGGTAGLVIGQRDSTLGPDCIAASVSQPTIVPLPAGITPRVVSGGGANTGSSGVGGGPSSGLGSLTPAGTRFPFWAGVLAAAGSIGVLGGLTVLLWIDPGRGRK